MKLDLKALNLINIPEALLVRYFHLFRCLPKKITLKLLSQLCLMSEVFASFGFSQLQFYIYKISKIFLQVSPIASSVFNRRKQNGVYNKLLKSNSGDFSVTSFSKVKVPSLAPCSQTPTTCVTTT
jgi:hypothetical protein